MMNPPPSPYQHYYDYLAQHVITPFYQDRLAKLSALQLNDVLKRKNHYLFKAKNLEVPSDLIRSIIDAYLSSQEETIFGNLLENFAIYVSQSLYSGFKSSYKSVDLEFERGGVYYLVGIKSGTNWGNADQIRAMKDSFKVAKSVLRERGERREILAVNGCIYGKDRNPLKTDATDGDKTYYKYAGQGFWHFISQDDQLYREIIVPIDQEARQKDEAFKSAYNAKINEMTAVFMANFMTNHQIDWVKLVDFVSRRG